MGEDNVTRKLAAILYADVAGYSRLTGADEEATHRALSASLDAITATIEGHGGGVLHYAGDAILAEFASVVVAVTGAIDIQRDLAACNHGLPDDRKLQFRIGVNLGDVIVDRGELYGDGVNVAARLESLADAGGICISRKVLEEVRDKLEVGYEFLGDQAVKNIERPIPVYRVLMDPEAVGKVIGEARPQTRSKPLVAFIASAAVALAVAVVWWRPWAPEFEPALIERMAHPLPDKPSVAVLPFDNYSDDPKLDFFVSGLTEDLTAALSKDSRLFVISRNSASTYKDKSVNVKQVAEELGVRYVLEGSVQKEGKRLRITVQLIDSLSGNHLWADRFARKASDIFALQDEITRRVFVELQVKLIEGGHARVASKGTNSLEAWLLRVEGYGELQKWTPEAITRARELLEAAHEADPKWARPMGEISLTHWYEARRGWSASRTESIRLGIDFAERAIELDPNEPLGYLALGNMYFLTDKPERGIEVFRKAIEVAPNSFETLAGMAMRIKDFGKEQEAIELFEHAMRLSPKYPWWLPFGYGLAQHLVGRKEDAVATFKKTIGLSPKTARIRARLAAVYADLGKIDKAKVVAEEVLQLNPKFSVSGYQKSYPFQDPKRNAWYRDLLLRAGLPE